LRPLPVVPLFPVLPLFPVAGGVGSWPGFGQPWLSLIALGSRGGVGATVTAPLAGPLLPVVAPLFPVTVRPFSVAVHGLPGPGPTAVFGSAVTWIRHP
jgi:hypothetical protein